MVTHVEVTARKVGLSLSYINAIQMVDNYIPFFDMQEQIDTLPQKNVDGQIAQVAKDILSIFFLVMGSPSRVILPSATSSRECTARVVSYWAFHRFSGAAPRGKMDSSKTGLGRGAMFSTAAQEPSAFSRQVSCRG